MPEAYLETRTHRHPIFNGRNLLLAFIAIVVAAIFMLAGNRKSPFSGAEDDLSTQREAVVANDSRASGSEARAVIAKLRDAKTPPDLERLFQQAGRFFEQKKLADAHVLYFFAAREGHPLSAFWLGNMADPMHHTQHTSLMDEPDPVQAYKWYGVAASTGHALAKDRLAELKKWAAAQADQGDPQAQRLLLGWP